MSPPSPSQQRTYIPASSAQVGRRAASQASQPQSQSIRQESYSSLGGALGHGNMRGASSSSSYMSEFATAGPSTTSATSHSTQSSEHRYLYHPSGMASAYEYSTYQHTTYDTPSQYAYTSSSLPPMRGATSPPPPPPPSSSVHSHYNPPPHTSTTQQPSTISPASTYPHYGQTPQYAIQTPPQASAPQQQQWPEESWTASQSFSPDPAQPMFVAGRSEVTASPQADPRAYMPQQYASPSIASGVRADDRGGHSYEPTQSKGKEREREQSIISTDRAPRTDFDSNALDFVKLSETYRQVLAVPTHHISLEHIERMLRNATLGMQLFDNSGAAPLSEDRRGSGDSGITEVQIISPPEQAPRRQNETGSGDAQTCLGCGATSTPEWRRGPLGPRTLCNACGLVYAKMIKKRGRDMGTNSMSTQPASGSAQSRQVSHANPAGNSGLEDDTGYGSPGDGGSDDGRSFGSQDPQ